MRIISLCPSLTELVCDLGLGQELVGVTGYCVHPSKVVRDIEKIGGPKNPKIERILELRPDLVLLNEEENRAEDAAALAAAGVSCLCSLPKTVEQTAEMVRSIGRELGHAATAEEIARDIEERSRRVRERATGKTPVRWAYLIWRKPWMAINAETFIDAMLVQAGGENVFARSPQRYPEIAIEELVAANPDIVLMATEPFPFECKHIAELAALSGWPSERFRIVDGEYLSWHGSRTPDGIDYAESVISAVRGQLAERSSERIPHPGPPKTKNS